MGMDLRFQEVIVSRWSRPVPARDSNPEHDPLHGLPDSRTPTIAVGGVGVSRAHSSGGYAPVRSRTALLQTEAVSYCKSVHHRVLDSERQPIYWLCIVHIYFDYAVWGVRMRMDGYFAHRFRTLKIRKPMEESDLRAADEAILDVLKEGRSTKGLIVDETGYSRNTVYNRLEVLQAAGHVKLVHEPTRLFELVSDPRDDN